MTGERVARTARADSAVNGSWFRQRDGGVRRTTDRHWCLRRERLARPQHVAAPWPDLSTLSRAACEATSGWRQTSGRPQLLCRRWDAPWLDCAGAVRAMPASRAPLPLATAVWAVCT